MTQAAYSNSLRWIFAAQLLSLDFSRWFYPELGVGILFQESLRGMMRDALASTCGRDAITFRPDSSGRVIAYEASILPALGRFTLAFGNQDRKRLDFWVNYVFGDDDNPWEPYEDHLLRWARHAAEQPVQPIATGFDTVGIAARLRASISISDIAEVEMRARHEPRSTWDKIWFDRAGESEIPTGSEYLPFLDKALLCIRMHRFQRYVVDFMSLLSEQEQEHFDQCTRALEIGNAPRFKDLPLPPP